MAKPVVNRPLKKRWSRIVVLGALWIAYRVVAARHRHADPFVFWVDVGMAIFVLLIGVLIAAIEFSKANREAHHDLAPVAGPTGIDIWMPAALVTLLVLGLMTLVLLSAR
jgi:hypothetical protein